MAYIGRGIENLSDRVVLDSLTASATASYTLQLNSVNFVPSSASSLTVSLNGVIQKPDSSYTVSGSTLTFSSALTSSDSIDFIIAERGITLQTPSAGSVGTSQLASTAVTTAKIADDAVTFDKMTGQNYPAFLAYISANQTIGNNTTTKINYDTELFDTDDAYDNSTNYRFTVPTGKGGKYCVFLNTKKDNWTSTRFYHQINLNGAITFFADAGDSDYASVGSTIILNLSEGDYIEGHMYQSSGASRAIKGGSNKTTFFGAYRIGD